MQFINTLILFLSLAVHVYAGDLILPEYKFQEHNIEKQPEYKFQEPKIKKQHDKATAQFKEYKEDKFPNANDYKKQEFYQTYLEAKNNAKHDLDRAFILRKWASSLWRIRPHKKDILDEASKH